MKIKTDLLNFLLSTTTKQTGEVSELSESSINFSNNFLWSKNNSTFAAINIERENLDWNVGIPSNIVSGFLKNVNSNEIEVKYVSDKSELHLQRDSKKVKIGISIKDIEFSLPDIINQVKWYPFVDDFKNGLLLTAKFSSNDISRLYLNGICIRRNVLLATDRVCGIEYRLKDPIIVDTQEGVDYVCHNFCIKSIQHFQPEKTKYGIYKGWLFLKQYRMILGSRLIETEYYPVITNALRTKLQEETQLEISKKFIQSLQSHVATQSSDFISSEERRVEIMHKDNRIYIGTRLRRIFELIETIQTDTTISKPIKIITNPKNLLDVISYCETMIFGCGDVNGTKQAFLRLKGPQILVGVAAMLNSKKEG